MARQRDMHWLPDAQRQAIQPHLPSGRLRASPGDDRRDDRPAISGIPRMLRPGGRWKGCRAVPGPCGTTCNLAGAARDRRKAGRDPGVHSASWTGAGGCGFSSAHCWGRWGRRRRLGICHPVSMMPGGLIFGGGLRLGHRAAGVPAGSVRVPPRLVRAFMSCRCVLRARRGGFAWCGSWRGGGRMRRLRWLLQHLRRAACHPPLSAWEGAG